MSFLTHQVKVFSSSVVRIPVEEEDVVRAGQSLQKDLLLRNGVGRVKLHPDELPHVLVHQTDSGAVNDVSDVGGNPATTQHPAIRTFSHKVMTKSVHHILSLTSGQ